MKKYLIMLLLLMTSMLLFVACENSDTVLNENISEASTNQGVNSEKRPSNNEYELTIEGRKELLYESPRKAYKAGSRIFIKTVIIMDANAVVKLNGEAPVSKRLVQDENGHYLYNEHEFIMPEKNSVLSLSVSGGMGVLEYSITVKDKYNDLYEQPKDFYAPGETVIVKTQLICDAEVVVELNGAKPLKKRIVSGEDGVYLYEEWEFLMPAKDSVVNVFSRPGMDAIYYEIDVIDYDNLVINQLSGMYAHGESFEVHSMHSDLEITVNGEALQAVPEAVLNNRGEVLYYTWTGFQINSDITVAVSVQSTAS